MPTGPLRANPPWTLRPCPSSSTSRALDEGRGIADRPLRVVDLRGGLGEERSAELRASLLQQLQRALVQEICATGVCLSRKFQGDRLLVRRKANNLPKYHLQRVKTTYIP